jgi:hypothetical protein
MTQHGAQTIIILTAGMGHLWPALSSLAISIR